MIIWGSALNPAGENGSLFEKKLRKNFIGEKKKSALRFSLTKSLHLKPTCHLWMSGSALLLETQAVCVIPAVR